MNPAHENVRPTRRCLDDLEVTVPSLDIPLSSIPDPVIRASQKIPERRNAGNAKRISALENRVWFKVKTSRSRGVVTELRKNEELGATIFQSDSWWLGTCGPRQADSPQKDFYANLIREYERCKTPKFFLLPTEWDWDRLNAEIAVAWVASLRRLVLKLISDSLSSGKMQIATARDHQIKVLVRADRGNETYIAVIANGIPVPQVLAVILDSVPGVNKDDWLPEPQRIPQLKLAVGDVAWSAILPPEVAAEILSSGEW